MSSFPEKLLEARKNARLTHTALAEKLGVSRRAVYAWENGVSVPRKNMIKKIAEALGVTVFYLTDDTAQSPDEGRVREENVNLAQQMFGAKGKKEYSDLLERNSAFFAGGNIPQEDKDEFFQVLMTAYVTAKEEAKKRFTSKSTSASGEKD